LARRRQSPEKHQVPWKMILYPSKVSTLPTPDEMRLFSEEPRARCEALVGVEKRNLSRLPIVPSSSRPQSQQLHGLGPRLLPSSCHWSRFIHVISGLVDCENIPSQQSRLVARAGTPCHKAEAKPKATPSTKAQTHSRVHLT
jgi:hypothetical protein